MWQLETMSFMFESNQLYPVPKKQSIKQEQNNIEWTVQFALENKIVKVLISNKPIGEITCPLVPWTVTFDVALLNMLNIQYPPIYQEKNADKKNYVFNENYCCVNFEYSVQPKDMFLKIRISNIRTKGIHKFQMRNFDSRDRNEDLVLDVDGVKLHCDSQILSQNSEIFRTMIKESEGSSEICLKDSIPLEDLRELLHYLYSSCEPVDDHNFRKLLHWGVKFEVNQIVKLCHKYMRKLVLGHSITNALRIEIFLLSWRYSVEHLKNIYTRKEVRVVSPDCMVKIVQSELYQDMDKDMKLQMWEFLVKTFER